MKDKKVIIIGSSRSKGNTSKMVEKVAAEFHIDIIDLNDYQISYYDYESKNIDDDFLPLIRRIIENYETFIFATPVYWYNMSGIMKVFFDRFSDLLRIEKETGKKLRGKKFAVLSNSYDSEIEQTFYIPFRKTADYLGMQYIGDKHFSVNSFNEEKQLQLDFIK